MPDGSGWLLLVYVYIKESVRMNFDIGRDSSMGLFSPREKFAGKSQANEK